MSEYEGVTHAGLAIVAADTGRVLLAQRALDETDAPEVRETWEFPGGALNEGEDPEAAAFREFSEEIDIGSPSPLPPGEIVNGWRSGVYQGFVYLTPTEFPVTNWAPTREVQEIAWADPAMLAAGDHDKALRPEIVKTMDWSLIIDAVSGNEDAEMDETDDFALEQPTLIHGILAPENTESGDKRGFNEGSLTTRPLRLPFAWQKQAIGAHDGAVTIASIDRVMRMGGMIHFEGTLLDSEEADEFAALLAHFGRYGVSIDGDRGSLDAARSEAEEMTWFEAARISGATAVSIPAFAEAYVAFGPHPDMPEDGSEESLAASGAVIGDLIGAMEFKRGKGWVTDPKATRRIHAYWTQKGEPGYAKIAWGTPGDFRRAKALIGAKIAKNSPEKMRYLNQIIAQWHFDALGYWPGDLGKPGNAPDTAENRKRAAVHAAEEHGIVAGEGLAWEAVLTSSAGVVGPPITYFDQHPESAALVIEEPDENGYRRTYGYAAEWGVCHIGFGGKCVEPPSDPEGGGYKDFHLGLTKVESGDFLPTGVITYKVDHRDAQTILSQSAEQQHFDNIAHAWASVRLGEDDRGIWFSGVVLPGIEADDLTLIQATGQVSGEWRSGAMRALQAVNVPGFPVMRSSAVYGEDGEVLALAASAFAASIGLNGAGESPCAPVAVEMSTDDPVGDVAVAVMERIEARQRVDALAQSEAAARMATARTQWAD